MKSVDEFMKTERTVQFAYQAYRNLLKALREKGCAVRNYHNYKEADHCVILRHEVDNSLEQAVRLSELETEESVSSTYFVLLRTDFYHPA